MDEILRKHVAAFKAALAGQAVECSPEKPINYGCQVVCRRGPEEIKVNFYHGKKGLSTVIQGKAGPLKDLLEGLAHGAAASAAGQARPGGDTILLPAGTTTWMGCDESGKGDVFGPLCCAACQVTTETADLLRRAGVCDSKALTDKAILTLADLIRQTLPDRWAVRIVMPGEYNSLYEMHRQKHENLNHLLGSLHAQNIRVLLSKHECPCIIVDKFGKEEYVLSKLGGLEKTHRIIQVPKGERDTAVAAASILAREAFVVGMDDLRARYGMTFPKGAYLGISQAIRQVQDHFGTTALAEVGKLNFKNFDFLR